jgi:hypothetical protein
MAWTPASVRIVLRYGSFCSLGYACYVLISNALHPQIAVASLVIGLVLLVILLWSVGMFQVHWGGRSENLTANETCRPRMDKFPMPSVVSVASQLIDSEFRGLFSSTVTFDEEIGGGGNRGNNLTAATPAQKPFPKIVIDYNLSSSSDDDDLLK